MRTQYGAGPFDVAVFDGVDQFKVLPDDPLVGFLSQDRCFPGGVRIFKQGRQQFLHVGNDRGAGHFQDQAVELSFDLDASGPVFGRVGGLLEFFRERRQLCDLFLAGIFDGQLNRTYFQSVSEVGQVGQFFR